MVLMSKLALIALGGALGSVMRYLFAGALQSLAGERFPVGTLGVNVLGCFLFGFLGFALAGPVLIREEYRLAILIGIIGGFTTFSTFGWETLALVNDGQAWRAGWNIVLTNTAALVAVWLGYRLAVRLYGG
jgi:fluoride exporter